MKYKLKLNFIGKDSVHYINELEVPKIVFDALQKLQTDDPEEELFSVSSADVNTFLKEVKDYLTPKLFRTAYGTKLIAEELQSHPINDRMTISEKKAIYDDACLVVAKKLNHQRNISKNFETQMLKVDENIQKAENSLNKTIEKSKDQLKRIQNDIETAKEVYSDNKNLLNEKLEKLKEKRIKIEEKIKKAENRVQKQKFNKRFKQDSASFAISTAKTNYSSPELCFSFCKDAGLDISFIYSKSLQEKFDWAKDASADYYKKYPNIE